MWDSCFSVENVNRIMKNCQFISKVGLILQGSPESKTGNKYFLMMFNEYIELLFAFRCPDVSAETAV